MGKMYPVVTPYGIMTSSFILVVDIPYGSETWTVTTKMLKNAGWVLH